MYLKVAPSMLVIGFPIAGFPLGIMCGKVMLDLKCLLGFHGFLFRCDM